MEIVCLTNETEIVFEIIKALLNFTSLLLLAIISYVMFQKRLGISLEIEKSGRHYVREIRNNDSQRSRIFVASIMGDYFKYNNPSVYDMEDIKNWYTETCQSKDFRDRFVHEIRFIKSSLEELGRITTSKLAWKGITRDFILDWTVDYYQFWFILLHMINYTNISSQNVECFMNKLKAKERLVSLWNARLKSETLPKLVRTLHLSDSYNKEILEKYTISYSVN